MMIPADPVERILLAAEQARDAGIPDDLNRWLDMTPADLAAQETKMTKAPGPKETAARLARAKAEDMRDTEVAKQRLAEIGANPNTLVQGHTTQPEAYAPAQTQESTVTKTAKAKKAPSKPAKKTVAKAPAKNAPGARAKPAGAPSASKGGIRPGSKLEAVAGLLRRPGGCTSKDILSLTGWPAVSVPQMAKSAGLTLSKEKVDGRTVYRAA